MRRIPVFEAAIIALGCERAASDKRRGRDVAHRFDSELEEVPFENVALGLIENQGMLQSLSRYETSLLNAYRRTLEQLIALQEGRACEDAATKIIDVVSDK